MAGTVNLFTDLRRIDSHRILRYRLRMDESRMVDNLAVPHDSLFEHVNNVVNPVRERIIRVLNRIEELETRYRELRAKKTKRISSKAYRKHLKVARKELKSYLVIWTHLIKEQGRLGLLEA